MKPYRNLPTDQRAIQQLVDQFNADELLWRKMEANRLSRRTNNGLTKAQREIFDFLDWVTQNPLRECIGIFKRR